MRPHNGHGLHAHAHTEHALGLLLLRCCGGVMRVIRVIRVISIIVGMPGAGSGCEVGEKAARRGGFDGVAPGAHPAERAPPQNTSAPEVRGEGGGEVDEVRVRVRCRAGEGSVGGERYGVIWMIGSVSDWLVVVVRRVATQIGFTTALAYL